MNIFNQFFSLLFDILPIIVILFGFQTLVLKQKIHNLKKILLGFLSVWVGLTFFLVGLESALFPIGKLMAEQLTSPAFLQLNDNATWIDYYWIYIFAALIGFATTIAEPSLLAVAVKAQKASGGSLNAWGLRIAVAVGVAIGISLGTFRIVTGYPLYYFIISGYVIVLIQTYFAPKNIIALAYDSGGVTTSTVTVPLVAALGLSLASNIEGRSPLIDGFGLIAFASLFPIMSVMFYIQFFNKVKT